MLTIDRLVIATHNRKKAGEMVTILSKRFPDLELMTLNDFPGAPEPDETADTYVDNALIKACSAAVFTGLPSLADDAGLEIDHLPGELGPHSKRFHGADTSFEAKMAVILDLMQDVPTESRGARFRCCVAFATNEVNGALKTEVFEATCEGRIATEPSGNGGFGYDPIFWLPDRGCTMADLTAEEKHRTSHRGKVLRAFGDWLALTRIADCSVVS